MSPFYSARRRDAELQQLLGQRYGTGTMLGIDPHWAGNVIEAVGNYGDSSTVTVAHIPNYSSTAAKTAYGRKAV